MRIDYSEPKQAYISGPGKNRPRKEPVGMVVTIAVITGLITFVIGFGSGWLLSQRSAKKAFQAAMEQNSLENAPKQDVPVQTPQPAPPAPAPQQPQTAANGQAVPGTQPAPEPPLTFYKTLPSGQKNMVLGSGFNGKEDKGKAPLQAAIPSNLMPPQANDAPKPEAARKEPAKPQPAEKPAARPEQTSYTVQVASYSLRSEAEALRSKLAGKGYNVSIVESNQGDKGIWYRVRVGRKLEQEAAKELAGKLGKGAIAIPE